ncbi:MAG: FAD-binding oxidoreductase [Chloroflexota bacterium]
MVSVEELEQVVGRDWVITRGDQIEAYLADQTPVPVRPPAAQHVVVVKPASAEEISQVFKLANKDGTPVYPRGGGTGICGGTVPVKGGIVLSLERLDQIEEVDRDNLMVVAQGGVTLADLLRAVEAGDLLFPPHPGDEGAQIGGLVACNAGGTRAVKYGVVRNYVKGLEVVLPTGEIVHMGGKLLKNNTGLDLMHLMVNSGGILGIITKVILRLYPRFAATATLIASWDDRHTAIRAVPQILRSGVIPLALEYVERDVIQISCDYLGLNWPVNKGTAHLIVIVSGSSEDDVYTQAETVSDVCQKSGAVDILMAERREEQAEILKIRSEMYSALKANVADVMDIAVPPAEIANYLDAVDAIAEKYNTRIPTYGHAGDGNLHPHVMRDTVERGVTDAVKKEVYMAGLRMGGIITAEHGVGRTKLDTLDYSLDAKSQDLMRGIKKLFDPHNILNPGAVVGGDAGV